MPAKALLAIDFGTSNTVAVLRQTGTADRPLLFAGSPVMPSAVFLDDDGRFHTGREAERMAQLDPAAFEPHPKQHVGVDLVLLGEREVPAADLAAAVLARVRQAAVEVLGEAPAAVLTHPAQWGPHRIAVLERAAAAADLEVSRLVAEPVAAAHRFAQVESVDSAAGLIGVFDLGGGTFDIAVLRRDRSGRFAVAAQGGQTDLGGVDLDQAIVGHLGALIEPRHPELWRRISLPETAADRRAHRQFRDDVREAKEMLSQSPMAPIALPGLDAALHLTRDEVDRLAAPLVEAAVALTGRTIGEAGCAPSDLAGLFLVGGASRMPLVGRVLHQRLQLAPTVLEQPELAVAQGALDAAEEPDAPPEPEPPSPPVPAPDFGGSPPMVPLEPAPLPPAPRRSTRSPVFAAGVGAFAVLADFWLMVVAMFPMGLDLGFDLFFSPQWGIGGYALAFVAMALAAGPLTGRWGVKRTYMVGLSGFAAAALLCALSSSLAVFMVGRIIQGAAAATVLAPATAMLNGEGRTAAWRPWGWIIGAAAVGGPIVGGTLAELLGWRPVFVFECLLGIVAIAWGATIASESRHAAELRIVPRPRHRPPIAGAVLTALLLAAVVSAPLVNVALWLQWGYGLRPLAAVLYLLPIAAAVLVTSWVSGRALRNIPPRTGIGAGLALIGVGWFLQPGLVADFTLASNTLALCVIGIGAGLCARSFGSAASAMAEAGHESGVAWSLNVSGQAGLVLGIAALGAASSDAPLLANPDATMITTGSIALIGAIPAAVLISKSRRAPEPQPEPTPAEADTGH